MKKFISKHNISKYIVQIISITFILCLVIFSDTSVNAARRGIKLWFEVVFPSLFPFFVASDILNKTGFVRVMGFLFEPIMKPLFKVPGQGAFAFLMGITSGYPTGAKITSELYMAGDLTENEAERLLAFTNNSGPLFIFGAVAVGMFKAPELGILLFSCHVAACISVGILFGLFKRESGILKRKTDFAYAYNKRNVKRKGSEKPGSKKADNKVENKVKGKVKNKDENKDKNKDKNKNIANMPDNKKTACKQSFGLILGESVKSSIMTILAIGGFIIFFSVVIALLNDTGVLDCISKMLVLATGGLFSNTGLVKSVLAGFFEITTGVNTVCSLQDISLTAKLSAASLIIGWAGLSVHAQVMGIVGGSGIKMKYYLLGKLMQGILAATYIYIAVEKLKLVNTESVGVFARNEGSIGVNMLNNLFASCNLLIFAASLLIIAIVMICLARILARLVRS